MAPDSVQDAARPCRGGGAKVAKFRIFRKCHELTEYFFIFSAAQVGTEKIPFDIYIALKLIFFFTALSRELSMRFLYINISTIRE